MTLRRHHPAEPRGWSQEKSKMTTLLLKLTDTQKRIALLSLLSYLTLL